MYPLQGRLWLILACTSLACALGCQQPPAQKSALGNLPGERRNNVEPAVNATTYFAHAHLLERQGQFDRAVVQYRKALALKPDFLSARNRLGITLNKLGRHAEASEQFRQAIAGHAELAYLHNNLGFSLYLEGKYVEALAALDEALALNTEFARAHMNRAVVLARLERFDEAYAELALAGSQADACFNMGVILTEAGRYADAARYLEAAVTARPDFDAARQQLREVARLAAQFVPDGDAQQVVIAPPPTEPDEMESVLPPETVGIADTETASPEPAESVVTETTVEEPAPAESETAPTQANAAEEPEPDAVEPVSANADEQGPETTEPLVANTDEPESEAIEPLTANATEPEPETTELSAASGDGEETSAPEPAEAAMADAAMDMITPPWPESLLTDVVVTENDVRMEMRPPAAIAAPETDSPEWAEDTEVDVDYLLALIDEALEASRNGSDDAEELWCRVDYYLFPETRPEPFPPAKTSAEQDILPETVGDTAVGK